MYASVHMQKAEGCGSTLMPDQCGTSDITCVCVCVFARVNVCECVSVCHW